MNGYVTAGYIISIGSLSAYGVSPSARVRAARARRRRVRGRSSPPRSTAQRVRERRGAAVPSGQRRVTIDPDESPDAATPDDVPPRPVLRSGPPRQRRSKKRLYLAGAVVVIAIGFLIYKGVTSAFVYFKTADQAIADRASSATRPSTSKGPSSRARSTGVPGRRLVRDLLPNKTTVTVDNTAVPPDLFQAGVPVVLVGHFIGLSETFASEQILVKHSNQYKAQYPSRVRSNSGVLH